MMIIDLSVPIYNGLKMGTFPAVEVKDHFTYADTKTKYLPPCQGCKVCHFSTIDHVGTHVDAPIHFIIGGKDISQVPVDAYMGDAIFVDLSEKSNDTPISGKMLSKALNKIQCSMKGKILLIRCTRTKWNEDGWLDVNTLTEEAADLIIECGFKAVGIDCLAVDCMKDMRRPVHMKLLSKEIVAIEALANMEQINKTQCKFIALPLKIQNGSASPVRAICIT
jgi:kynurenine formamidase